MSYSMPHFFKLLLLVFVFSSTFSSVAQKQFTVDSKASSVHWLGEKITESHEGFIALKEGAFTVDATNENLTQARFVMDMSSITCTDLKDKNYASKLIGHLASTDFFDTKQFPTATFTLTKPARIISDVVTLTGDLEIKGITKPVSFILTRHGNNLKGRLEIDRTKYGIRYGSKSFFNDLGNKIIKDVFTITFNLFVAFDKFDQGA